MPSAILLTVTLAACDARSVIPTAIAPSSVDASVAASGAPAKYAAGEYRYEGCLAGFNPPVCIPARLVVEADGKWILMKYITYTTADYPDWRFHVYDLWHWASRNGKCVGGGDPYYGYDLDLCVPEPRYVRTMSFDTWVDAWDLNSPPPYERKRVYWTYVGRSPH